MLYIPDFNDWLMRQDHERALEIARARYHEWQENVREAELGHHAELLVALKHIYSDPPCWPGMPGFRHPPTETTE